MSWLIEWIEKHGGTEGRLHWFEAYEPQSPFYQFVAKPLLSMRTTGSMDTECAAKPLKNALLTKQRNRLSDHKAMVLFRASQNLKHLHRFKTEMKQLSNPPTAVVRELITQKWGLIGLSVVCG